MRSPANNRLYKTNSQLLRPARKQAKPRRANTSQGKGDGESYFKSSTFHFLATQYKHLFLSLTTLPWPPKKKGGPVNKIETGIHFFLTIIKIL